MDGKKGDGKMIKSCFSHLGGKFGTRLTIRLEELGWIVKDRDTKHFFLTKKGEREFNEFGGRYFWFVGVNVQDKTEI